jgi:hypothetical protein
MVQVIDPGPSGGQTAGHGIGSLLGGLLNMHLQEGVRKREQERQFAHEMAKQQAAQQAAQQTSLAEQTKTIEAMGKIKSIMDSDASFQDKATAIYSSGLPATVANGLVSTLQKVEAQKSVDSLFESEGGEEALGDTTTAPTSAPVETSPLLQTLQQGALSRATGMQQPMTPPVQRVGTAAPAPVPPVAPTAQAQPAEPMTKKKIDAMSDHDLLKLVALGGPQKAVAEQALKIRQHKEDIQQKNVEANRKERHEFHKESADYDEQVRDASKAAKKQIQSIQDIRSALKSGKVKPGSIRNMFRGMGKIGDRLADAFQNAEEGKFEAATPALIEGWKEVFGTRITDTDLNFLMRKLPDIGKSVEANDAIAAIIEKYAQAPILRYEVAKEIKKQHGGLRPLGFADMVEEEVDKRLGLDRTQDTGKVGVINPKTGKMVMIPQEQLQSAMDAGGKLANG